VYKQVHDALMPIETIATYLTTLPLELFTLIASFLEELISPIPSFLAYVPAGAALQARGGAVEYVLVLAVIGGVGHLLGSLIIYTLANTMRDYIFTKRAAWLGVRKTDVTAFRNKLGNRWSGVMLFGMWALPIFPGAPLSVLCGFVRFPLGVFVTATFFGSIINAACYLCIGYYGLQTLAALKVVEWSGQVLVLLIIVGLIAWWVAHHGRRMVRRDKKKDASES
jgi:membrane protein DedA with SNARE-associated domain